MKKSIIIVFEYMDKASFSSIAPVIFEILADNMEKIAPTGNEREEDFNCWYGCVKDGLERDERQIVIIKNACDGIIGYFQYFTNADTFRMEEIQFKPECQGEGVFRKLYGFLLPRIDKNIEFVDAFASIHNEKSIGILEHLGLENVGLNKNGRSYHYKGKFEKLKEWYENEDV